jgi:hypothetical protein
VPFGLDTAGLAGTIEQREDGTTTSVEDREQWVGREVLKGEGRGRSAMLGARELQISDSGV